MRIILEWIEGQLATSYLFHIVADLLASIHPLIAFVCGMAEMEALEATSGHEEKALLQSIMRWIAMSAVGADVVVNAYADAILCFGVTYAMHIYDLLRLVLKMRVDVHKSIRCTTSTRSATFYHHTTISHFIFH